MSAQSNKSMVATKTQVTNKLHHGREYVLSHITECTPRYETKGSEVVGLVGPQSPNGHEVGV